MGFSKNNIEKEFVCRVCMVFLDNEELLNGCCPECKNDDSLFINDLNQEE